MTKELKNNIRIYNTPTEIGLRLLILLNESKGSLIDIEKMMYLDFLCLHTADIGGPESLHAPIPNRGVQVFSKKELIQKGITVLLSKELIELKPTTQGFMYAVTEAGTLFLTFFQTNYFTKLVERCKWVVRTFGGYSSGQFKTFIDANLLKWGSEFSITDNPKLI